ncbi:hypothetical protein GGF42_007180 [Coemansia sp. RSA 2424]|nr:hypothetical protein GGF42_007180 [Coemansia sp. RSA 2424]
MPNYQVVRCASDDCAKFQSQQEKKTNKWACVVCGLKQSVRRVYFQSTAPKECRPVVMELNMNRGQAESAKLNRASQADQSHQHLSDNYNGGSDASQDMTAQQLHGVGQGAKAESRWTTYEDNAEDTGDKPEDAAHDLDRFNRVVVGKIEQSEAKKQATVKTAKRKAPTPRVQPRSGLATSQLPQQQPAPVRHMPYRRPESHADPQSTDKPSFLQAVASVAQKSHPANLSTATTASNNASELRNPMAVANPRSALAGSVNTQDTSEYASASKWSQFDSNDSDAGSEAGSEDS